jgi:hypothetical protein
MEEELVVKASKSQLEEFKESLIWADLKNELLFWKEGFENELSGIVGDAEKNNPSTAVVLLHIGDINGRMKAVDYMLSIPDILISYKEDNKDGRNKTD